RAVFGVEMPVRRLFEAPTVAALAGRIEREETQHGPAIAGMQALRTPPMSPTSFAQQRLWFLDQLEPGSAAYNIPAAVEVAGRLDVAVLDAALAEVVRRHEALRTVFQASPETGEPVQVVSSGSAALPVVDLVALPESRRDGEARRLAEAEARRPFLLSVGPLLRTTVLRQTPERFTVVVVMHHIVSDGWSLGVLVRELGALYTALSGVGAGEPSPLPELAVQYGKFAAWQRRQLSAARLEPELAWWRQELAGMPPALDLLPDHPRPAALGTRGAEHRFGIGGEALAGLTRLARQQGATLFMTLLAGFTTLLHRATGQDDLAVATPVAGRTRVETEPLIGLFVNTLVLRARLEGDPTFVTLLGRLRETTLAAFAHQEVPFERLVEELMPERDLSRPPLAQVMLAVQNAPAGALALPGLSLRTVPLATGTSKLELTVDLTETMAGLEGRIEYNTDLFDATTAARLLA